MNPKEEKKEKKRVRDQTDYKVQLFFFFLSEWEEMNLDSIISVPVCESL